MNDEESKWKVDIIKGDEALNLNNQSSRTAPMHQLEQEVSPGQQNDSISVGAIEQDHFPLKLHKLLEQLEKEGKSHIIGWNPDGKSFAVFRPKEFAADIMAKHFRRQSRYKSFQRQLNLYAFKRECHGHIKGVYSHEMFVRNNRDLCKGMKRERASSSKADRKSLVGTTAVRGVNSGRSSNQSDASSSQSPDLSSRKRSLQMTAQHERDMLLASQDRVALAMKQKLYRMTNAVSGSIAARKKMKEDSFRGSSEPTFMMSAVDCDNNKISSVDQETSSVSLIPNFELREGYRNTSSSSLVANYPHVDMNLTYQNQSKHPPMYKDAPDIPLTTASSAIALRAVSNSNNMIRQNQRSPGQYFVPGTHLLAPSTPAVDSSTGVSRDDRKLSPTSHPATSLSASSGNLMGLANHAHDRAEEDDSGSIGTIDDFDNMMG